MNAVSLLAEAPVAQVNAAALMLALLIWGVLMGLAGAALTWVLKGDRIAEDRHEPRPFHPGRLGVRTSEANDTTVIIPTQRRPPRLSHEMNDYQVGAETRVLPTTPAQDSFATVHADDQGRAGAGSGEDSSAGATVRLPRQRAPR